MAGEPVRVALVDDHHLLSAALSAALTAEGHEVVVPMLSSLDAVAAQLLEAAPHVVLLDLDLGALGDGEGLLAPLLASGASVLVVSATTDEATVGRCLERGAAGWVPKSASFDDLLAAVLAATDGQLVLESLERRRLIGVWHRHRDMTAAVRAPFDRLTRREAAVLALLVRGETVERIAAASFVSRATVRTQVRAILSKLGVNSQLEAVAMATRTGWQGPRG